jgi:Ca-activated chloride channel family protein
MTSLGAAKKIEHDESPRPALLILSLSLLALSVFASPGRARAQSAAPEQDEVIRVETNLVAVPVVVTDGGGRRVHGLAASDFDVRDEGRDVEVAYFGSGAERVALLFLLDASGSTRDLVAGQGEAALALFSRFGQRSRVSLMHFQERPETAFPFTRDTEAARAAFRSVSLPGRRTAIFDAALAAARAFDSAEPAERRIVLLISDGLDTASRVPPAQVVAEAAARGVTFYVIHTPLYAPREGRLAPRPAAKGFRDLAGKTGGQLFVVGDAQASLSARPQYDLRPVFQAIEDDLRGQYVLGFHAGASEGSPRTRRVEVSLKSQTGRRLRVRQLRGGYVPNGRPAAAP